MAKDLVSSLGNAELNALMAVQLTKMNSVVAKINGLFKENNCTDFNSAYQSAGASAEFVTQRNALLDDLNNVLDVMDKLRTAQNALTKDRRKEQRSDEQEG